MLGITFSVTDFHIDNISFSIGFGSIYGIDEAFVGCQFQLFITCQDFAVQFGVDLHGIVFHQLACGLEIAFALDALDFTQELAEELTKLENVFDNYAKIIAAALRRTDYTGGSRTLGSFYKSDIGYGISRENMDKTFARELFKGYGIVLNTTITDLLISVELFNDEEAPEFVEGTGIPSVDADEDIADVKVDTTNKNIIIDAHSDGIKAAVLESLMNFTALRYDTLTIEIEENANGLVYTGAKVVATASSSTGTAVIEYTIIILGDVNGDGKASALDATVISNTYLYDTPLTEAQKLAADMNGNGSVNAADATLIVNKFLYWDEYESSL